MADRRRERPVIITCDLPCAPVFLTPTAHLLARIHGLREYAWAQVSLPGREAADGFSTTLHRPSRLPRAPAASAANGRRLKASQAPVGYAVLRT
ncbi:hypothetical protein [Streptomyces deccanensis]|uniref:hypothetical protein n=1 Tax=Streptomyces deccanensis TaxID=424188 RepID=UPI001EFA6166|nr:hypothetical protein [Streptomyces deccanensis]ULR56360.1 hypothetical protein L3078_03325 [Streptomyces deccanensis]